MRCFLINRDNVRTYRLLQDNFQVDLNTLFYMGKMNLLHISCDIGWSSLAEELVRTGTDVEQRCPSLHMGPASLTPLMLAAGAGHTKVVAALLESEVGVDTEAKDGYGMTALFHTCNHGLHRVRARNSVNQISSDSIPPSGWGPAWALSPTVELGSISRPADTDGGAGQG